MANHKIVAVTDFAAEGCEFKAGDTVATIETPLDLGQVSSVLRNDSLVGPEPIEEPAPKTTPKVKPKTPVETKATPPKSTGKK